MWCTNTAPLPFFFFCTSVLFSPMTILNAAEDLFPSSGVGPGKGPNEPESPTMVLYMHDLLGGSSPTARPITGLLGNIYSGQVPFARPLGFTPPKNGVQIPNSNGVGVALGTGLAGTAFAGTTANNDINCNNNNQQLTPDGLGLGFGTITVIDDYLTISPSFGSQKVGKAQGVYVATSAEGRTQLMGFTAMFEGGEYGDSINLFGVYMIGSVMSKLSVTGGTGRFNNASGFAEIRPLVPEGHSDAAEETLLRIIIHLKY